MSALRARIGMGVCCAALVACGAGENEPSALALPDKTNLLLITLDTTRADRIGSYGYENARTPNLDRLAAGGVRFARAYAHVPLTLPTHASLFTGTLPPEHGIHDNGRRALSPELTTLAEIFRDKGYSTGAFVSAIALDGSFGLNRGFEVYDDELGDPSGQAGRHIHRPGSQTTDNALQWLNSTSAPFFLWVHYYDPHFPYEPPAFFATGDPYDGEIAAMDREVGRLLSALADSERSEQTLVVAIADHGESLQEKGEHTHAALIYDGTQRIPFLMHLAGSLPAGQVVDGLAGQSDLLPTLMQLFNWSTPDQTSGMSLVPEIVGKPLIRNSIWIESEYAALNFGWSSLLGVVQGEWKYVDAPTPELYNLITDPSETINLAQREAQTTQRLRAHLNEMKLSMGSFASAGVELDAEMARDLASLGYAQGASTNSTGSPNRPASAINPVEHIATLELYHLAIGLGNQGRYAETIPPLESVRKAFPNAAGFRTQLGDAYRRVGRLADARLELEAAVELEPNYDPAHFYLGELARTEGNAPLAIAAYRRTLALRPDYRPAKQWLATLLAETGDNQAALVLFQDLAQSDPPEAKYFFALADLFHRLQRETERIGALERAIELDPADLGAVNTLAWALCTSPAEGVRDGERALLLATRNAEASGGSHPEPLLTLAAAQAEVGQWELATATLEQALALAEIQHPKAYVEELKRFAEQLNGRSPLRD